MSFNLLVCPDGKIHLTTLGTRRFIYIPFELLGWFRRVYFSLSDQKERMILSGSFIFYCTSSEVDELTLLSVDIPVTFCLFVKSDFDFDLFYKFSLNVLTKFLIVPEEINFSVFESLLFLSKNPVLIERFLILSFLHSLLKKDSHQSCERYFSDAQMFFGINEAFVTWDKKCEDCGLVLAGCGKPILSAFMFYPEESADSGGIRASLNRAEKLCSFLRENLTE